MAIFWPPVFPIGLRRNKLFNSVEAIDLCQRASSLCLIWGLADKRYYYDLIAQLKFD
jgi:hypothetical protein